MEVKPKMNIETQDDIEKRIEGLSLLDKCYDEQKIRGGLTKTESTNDFEGPK